MIAYTELKDLLNDFNISDSKRQKDPSLKHKLGLNKAQLYTNFDLFYKFL